MSSRPQRAAPRLGLGLVLVAVLLATLFALPRHERPGATEPSPTGPPPAAEPPGAEPAATADPAPSEEAFCAGFRAVVAVRGQYLAQPDEIGANLLQDALDDLLATGVPHSMEALARSGYFVRMSELYGTVGERLDPGAVPGAADTPPKGAPDAFDAWLTDLCPGR